MVSRALLTFVADALVLVQTEPMTGVRERVRAEMLGEIKAAARAQLATEGANLSLRAIARDLGMVSSAIYRYYRSRDELLTALILDAYNALADAATAAEAVVPRDRLADRYAAVARAIRRWALANRAEYALLFGSPVPGYAAPPDTTVPVTRLSLVVIDILRDGVVAGVLSEVPGVPDPVTADMAGTLEAVDRSVVPPSLLAAGLAAWTGTFGLISFELWGHLNRVVSDYDAFFDHQVRRLVAGLGLAPDTPQARPLS